MPRPAAPILRRILPLFWPWSVQRARFFPRFVTGGRLAAIPPSLGQGIHSALGDSRSRAYARSFRIPRCVCRMGSGLTGSKGFSDPKAVCTSGTRPCIVHSFLLRSSGCLDPRGEHCWRVDLPVAAPALPFRCPKLRRQTVPGGDLRGQGDGWQTASDRRVRAVICRGHKRQRLHWDCTAVHCAHDGRQWSLYRAGWLYLSIGRIAALHYCPGRQARGGGNFGE